MELREDYHMHTTHRIVLLWVDGSYYLRVLKVTKPRNTYLTPKIEVAESDLLRVARSNQESLTVHAEGVRVAIIEVVAILLDGSEVAHCWGGRPNFQVAVLNLIRSVRAHEGAAKKAAKGL